MTQVSTAEPISALPAIDYSRSRVLAPKAVCQLTSIGKSQLHKLTSEGRFPQPVQLSEGRIGYLEHEVLAWLDDRIAERDQLLAEREAAA